MPESPAALATVVLIVAAVHLAGPALPAAAMTPSTMPGGTDERTRAEFWIDRCEAAEVVLLDAAAVAALNHTLLAADRSVRDLAALADAFTAAEVTRLVSDVSRLPDAALTTADGRAVDAADRDRWLASCDLGRIPDRVVPRFAIVTRRAALRRFPTRERVWRTGGAADIDLFQESAFFPGTPVAVVHTTADGRWAFVVGATYAAWIESESLASTPREAALDFARRSSRIVVAARATAVPVAVADGGDAIPLDMGTALPPADGSPAADMLVELPRAAGDGGLAVVPARVEPADAVHAGPLTATRGNLLRQAFAFLGERYGWGHDHGARDCSGFVCEVYRSLGILLPRNTRDQAASPAFDRTVVAPDWPRDRRRTAVGTLRAGDLVYVPRHVMMVVGHDATGTWVIHDTHAGRLAGDPPPEPATGVVVAPLDRILADDGTPIVDSITVLVRILPRRPAAPPPSSDPPS